MDTNMLSFIENAIKSGKTVDDIANEMAAALNHVEKSTKTTEYLLDGYYDEFDAAIDDGSDVLNSDILAGYITYCIATSGKVIKTWTPEEVEDVKESIEFMIDNAEDFFVSIKDFAKEMEGLLSLLNVKSAHKCTCNTPAPASTSKPTPGPNASVSTILDDKAIIEKFLRKHNL